VAPTPPRIPTMSSSLWTAFALVLVIEGLPLLVAPARWRAVVHQVSSLADGQLRFFGLVLVLIGLAFLLLLGRN
jgi:uncharacterized protein YjeT (DUF2065 family)